MKSLQNVQVIAKVLYIFSVIAFVCTIIGAVGCFIGACVMLLAPLLGEELVSLILTETGAQSIAELPAALFAVCIYLIGGIFAAWFVLRYFKHELADGTPFTHRGAKELCKTGILNLAIPFGTMILASIVIAVAGVSEGLIRVEYNATTGVAMILLSFLLHYGADLAGDTGVDLGRDSNQM